VGGSGRFNEKKVNISPQKGKLGKRQTQRIKKDEFSQVVWARGNNGARGMGREISKGGTIKNKYWGEKTKG